MLDTLTIVALPKPSERRSQDAFAAKFHRDTGVVALAVADGVSCGLYARRWAKVIAENWVESPVNPGQLDEAWHGAAVEKWDRFVGRRITYLQHRDSLTPYLKQFASRRLSGATGVFVRIEKRSETEDGFPCDMFAVGDCVAFIFRDDMLQLSFPIDDPDAFNDTPNLIRTQELVCPADIQRWQGVLKDGDTLLLASDALAEWVLRRIDDPDPEIVKETIRTLRDATPTQWRELIHFERQLRADRHPQGDLRNDDHTLLRVTVRKPAEGREGHPNE